MFLNRENDEVSTNLNEEEKRRQRIIVYKKSIIFLLLLWISCIVYATFYDNSDTVAPPSNIIDFEIDNGAEEGGLVPPDTLAIQEALNKKIEESMINISMNLNPVFEDGQSEGNLMIINDKSNNFIQVIEIYTEDTNELIYRSGGIPVGSKIENATLDVDLEKGDYDAVAYFIAVRDTGEYVGKAGAKIKILVLN